MNTRLEGKGVGHELMLEKTLDDRRQSALLDEVDESTGAGVCTGVIERRTSGGDAVGLVQLKVDELRGDPHGNVR